MATFSVATASYGHGALGPGHEWARLNIQGDAGSLSFQDERALVFEDIAPRLIDLDGDGDNEAMVVESSQTQGSRLAIWTGEGRLAATAFIGNRHRWLAPAGAADLDGDGRIEIAYVETPHLGRVLKIARLEGDRLVRVAEARGLTNHRFGEPVIEGRIAICAGRPTILTANADWTRIVGTTLAKGKLAGRDLAAYMGPASFDRITGCD
ncbi:MAG: VCBS repeat-containing protein [Rhodobacteraceae bacterium]|nr:VCBS repeat-containing protein [Paracoccaceae bacterium]